MKKTKQGLQRERTWSGRSRDAAVEDLCRRHLQFRADPQAKRLSDYARRSVGIYHRIWPPPALQNVLLHKSRRSSSLAEPLIGNNAKDIMKLTSSSKIPSPCPRLVCWTGSKLPTESLLLLRDVDKEEKNREEVMKWVRRHLSQFLWQFPCDRQGFLGAWRRNGPADRCWMKLSESTKL